MSTNAKASSSKSSSKYNVVSSSALFDLRAELEKGKETFTKAAGSSDASYVKGLKREGKKPTKWGNKSKGVEDREARQNGVNSVHSSVRLGKVDKPTMETSREGLERKAKIYEQLRKGKSGGLSEKQLETALIDWDKKIEEGNTDSETSEEDELAPTEDDPLTDYEDNFGRTRTVPRSEVPIYALDKKRHDRAEAEEKPANLIIGDQQYYPVYEPSLEDLKARWKAAEGPPDEKHYDGNAEVRNKSAAFYQFSADSAKRAQQQAELLATRKETEAARRSISPPPFTTANSLDPSLPSSSTADSSSSAAAGVSCAAPEKPPPVKFGGKASEKRKRELEERKRVVEEKRRKKEAEGFLAGLEGELGASPPSPPPSASTAE